MGMEVFKPSDFVNIAHKEIWELANRIVQERVFDMGERVYASKHEKAGPGSFGPWNHSHHSSDTHSALLINIQPLEKPKCEHERKSWANKIPGWHHGHDSEVVCDDCGVKLKAKWLAEGDE